MLPPPVSDDELRKLYLDKHMSFEQIAARTGLPRTAVVSRIVPGMVSSERTGSPPRCDTCFRPVRAVRKLLRSLVRAVPVPDFCLFCARPKAEVRIELSKATARLGVSRETADRPHRAGGSGSE